MSEKLYNMEKLIITLGYSLNEDGSLHDILQGRLDRSLELANDNDLFLVCGKSPPKSVKPDRCENLTEAEAMGNYLVQQGISKARVLVEKESMTTLGNAYYSYSNFICTMKNIVDILIVSNEFHMPLVKYCFKKILGSHYPYRFDYVLDKKLKFKDEELKAWNGIINSLVNDCYPILFKGVKDGDIDAINKVINSPVNERFAKAIRKFVRLDKDEEVFLV